MFCKNCGATIPAADEKCARCGFKAPALSDCGGFYDLAPNAPKAAPVPRSAPVAVAPDKKKSEGMGRWIVLSILALVILALQVFIFVKLADHENRLDNLFRMIADAEEEQTTPKPSGDQDNNEEPQQTAPETTPSSEPAPTGGAAPDDPEPSIPQETDPPTTVPTEQAPFWANRLICVEDNLEQDDVALMYLDGERTELTPVRDDGEGRTKITYCCDAESDRSIVVAIEDFASNLYKVYCSLYGDFGTLSVPGIINIYDGETLVCGPLEATVEGETIFAEVDLSAVVPGKSLRCEICWDNEEEGCVTVTLNGLTVPEEAPDTELSHQQITITDTLNKDNDAEISLGLYTDGELSADCNYKRPGKLTTFIYKLDNNNSIIVYYKVEEEEIRVTVSASGDAFGTHSAPGRVIMAYTDYEGVYTEAEFPEKPLYGNVDSGAPEFTTELAVPEQVNAEENVSLTVTWYNDQGGSITVTIHEIEFD